MPRRRAHRGEEGSAAAEMAILTTPLVLVLLLIVAGGRYVSARAEVDAAARDATRAASIERSPEAAVAAARDSASASLDAEGLACRDFAVTVDTANFVPGGTVVAEVSCTVSLTDVSLLRLPGSRTITSRFVAPIDTYRGIGDGFGYSEASSDLNSEAGGT